jgi:hypothetical protein
MTLLFILAVVALMIGCIQSGVMHPFYVPPLQRFGASVTSIAVNPTTHYSYWVSQTFNGNITLPQSHMCSVEMLGFLVRN